MLIDIKKGVRKRTPKGSLDFPNDAADVKTVQQLLVEVGELTDEAVTGEMDDVTEKAIGAFQSLFGSADYAISPRGTTIKRLNAVAEGLALKKVTLTRYDRTRQGGVYAFKYSGLCPFARKGASPYKVFVHLDASSAFAADVTSLASVDVTDLVAKAGKLGIVAGKDELAQILAWAARGNLWGKEGDCSIHLVRGTRVMQREGTKPATAPLRYPVKPYDGPLAPDLAERDPPMTYAGNGTGSWFYPEALAGRRYFFCVDPPADVITLATRPGQRGFDCTTYPGTVLGIDPNTRAMSAFGSRLAFHITSAQERMPGSDVVMENRPADEIVRFFEHDQNKKGAFILWFEKHVMLVIDGIVHEFNLARGGKEAGFQREPVATRIGHTSWFYSVRRIPPAKIPAEWAAPAAPAAAAGG